MRRRTQKQGYTIIEVMIVMAASSMLALFVMFMISGQQGKTEFAQAVRSADTQMKDVLNDYSTGFFDRPTGINCSADDTGNPPTVIAGGNIPGSNIGCIYVGRLVELSSTEGFRIHTLVGRQYVGPVLSQEVGSLGQARPVLLYPKNGGDTTPDLSQVQTPSRILTIKRATYLDTSNAEHSVGAFGVVSRFNSTINGQLDPGRPAPQLVIATNFPMTGTPADLANYVASATASDAAYDRPFAICFDSNGSNQHGIIRIGVSQAQLATNTIIGAGTCASLSTLF